MFGVYDSVNHIITGLTGCISVSGTTAVAISDPDRTFSPGVIERPITWEVLSIIGLSCNVILTLFGTINIVVRLLLHRRSIITAFGRTSALAKHQRCISSILLESAVLNIPMALLAIIGLFVGKITVLVIMPIVVHGQVRFEYV